MIFSRQNDKYIDISISLKGKYYNIINTIFQLLEAQTEQMKLLIGKELENVKYLKENSRGKDDRSIPKE